MQTRLRLLLCYYLLKLLETMGKDNIAACATLQARIYNLNKKIAPSIFVLQYN